MYKYVRQLVPKSGSTPNDRRFPRDVARKYFSGTACALKEGEGFPLPAKKNPNVSTAPKRLVEQDS